MTARECPREQDVIAALIARRWSGDGDELRIHALECPVCKEIVDVVGLLHLDREDLHEEVNVPAAGQVWWRAAIRARLEASQQATRPLSWLFGISVACVIGLALAAVELLWSPVQYALRAASPSPLSASSALSEIGGWLTSLANLAPFTTTGFLVLLGATACLLLAPLALYFALSDE
jgi:hypothetical protein